MEYFLLLMSLRIALDKKEIAEINDSLRIILMGRAANTTYLWHCKGFILPVLDGVTGLLIQLELSN